MARQPSPKPTLDAITGAFLAARDRLAGSPDLASFLEQALAIAGPAAAEERDRPVVDVLFARAGEGSIEAAAALAAFALGCRSKALERKAEEALKEVLRRNPAARDELVHEGLTILVEEELTRQGVPFTIDPETGEKIWGRAP